jgi:hypothetical protein
MQASALGNANQRGAQKGVAGDIDFLAPGELDFQLLCQYGRGGEAPNELLPRFRAAVSTTLIDQYGSIFYCSRAS